MRRLGVLLLLSLLSACKESSPGGGPGSGGTAGVGPTLELEPLQMVNESDLVPLVDGKEAPLSHALQGGWVFYVGARVRQLESPFVVATAKVIDPQTDVVHTEQTRTLELVADPEDSTAMIPNTDGRSHVVHLLVCPNYTERDIQGLPWRFEIEVREAYGDRSGSSALTLTPACPADSAELEELCVCECTARYDQRVCGKTR